MSNVIECSGRTIRSGLRDVRRRVAAAAQRSRAVNEEGGQTLVLISIALVALLGLTAIVFDTAIIFEERRQLQNAADGAALAAARELPGAPSEAVAAAQSYLAANGYEPGDAEVSVAINTPYLGDPEDIEVVVTRVGLPYFFGRLIGLTTLDVSARAVSEIVSAYEDDYAIFAISSSCGSPGVNISGSLATFEGTVHANSNVTIGGNGHSFLPAITYQCSFTEGGSGHIYEREQKSTGERDTPPAVANVTFASFAPCDFSFATPVNLKSRNEVWQDPQKTILLDGVYCFEKSVSLSGDDIVGNVTFVARGNIDVSGSDHVLTAYHPNGILFYSEASVGTNEIDLTGSDGRWTGLIYAPNGDVKINGQANHTFEGSVVAQNVSVSGSGLTVSSSRLTANSNPVVRLVE